MSTASVKLKKLFDPRSIAIVGAAREPNKLGNIIVANIQKSGYSGKIFPVNPHAEEVNGLACYESYSTIPAVPDLALVAVPADVCLEALPEIAKKGTKNIVIFSAGFKEIGVEGAKREKKLIDIAHSYGLHIIGPNCLGFVNNVAELNATFGNVDGAVGNVRFISQSGAIATAIFDWSRSSKVSYSSFITLGNKTVLSENDILEYLLSERPLKRSAASGFSDYEPIGLYLESIEDGSRFLELAAELGQRHPLFVLKPGKSKNAQAAMQSHTGAMANDDVVLGTALASVGVARCDGLEDFFDLAQAFAWENAPEGPGVAIVSNAGGPGVLTTDAVAQEGLTLATISPRAKRLLEKALPRAANLHNPIDVLGDALSDRYAFAIEAVLNEKNVDALIVLLTPQVMTEIEVTAKIIATMSARYCKPILCSFMGGGEVEIGERVLRAARIPCFAYPERAVKALAQMYKWKEWQKKYQKPPVAVKHLSFFAQKKWEDTLASAVRAGSCSLPSFESQNLVEVAGITIAPSEIVRTVDQAVAAAGEYGYPVVLKISSAQALHKTELHGVVAGITSTSALEAAFKSLQNVKNKIGESASIMIQKHVLDGLEVLVGIKRDAQFGPVVMLGAGGVLSELVADRNLALAPLTDKQITHLINHSKIGQLIAGYRGHKPYALHELVKLVRHLIAIAEAFPTIKEIEINPVILTNNTAYAVDTKIVQAIETH